MTALTSILVRDHAVPVRKIEEALERQVVSGGDLETALLELDAIPEDVLSAYRAATYGLLPATRDEVMGAAPDVVRLVPREVAEREGIVPLRTEERILVAATATPPTPERDQQLGFFLGYDLVYRVVSPVRMAIALGRHYGVPVDGRLARLGDRLARRDPGVATYVAPPPSPATAGGPLGPSLGAQEPLGFSGPPPLASTTPAPAEPGHPVPRVFDATVVDHVAPAFAPTLPGRPRAEAAAGSGLEPGAGSDVSRALPDSGRSVAVPRASSPDLDANRAVPRPDYGDLGRRRGPLAYEEAVDLLRAADHHVEVLAVLFAYARQFFDYVALFVVADGGLVGRDAKGPGASADAVNGARVEPSPGSTLAAVVDSGAPACVDLDVQPRDRTIVQLLGRSGRQPAALVPATVRRRTVVLVYGDQGGDPMVLPDLGRLLALLPRVSEAFERLILRRKAEGASLPPPASSSDTERPDPVGGQTGAPPDNRQATRESASASGFVEAARLGAADTEPAPPPRMSPLPPRGPASRGAPQGHRPDEPSSPVANVDPRPTLQPGPRPSTPRSAAGPGTASYSVRPGAIRPPRSTSVDVAPSAAGGTRRLPAVPGPDEPSVIVDMGRPIDEMVEQLVTSGPDDANIAVEPLLRVGEAALPALIRHFPGPLWFHRGQPHRRLPRGRDVSSIARALVAFGPAAVPYLGTLVCDGRADVRFYGLLVASDLTDRRLPGVVAPGLLDEDEGVRRLALDVLRAYRRFPDVLARALHRVRGEARAPRRGSGDVEVEARRLRAVEALGELWDRESVDLLVGLLDDPLTAESARAALVAVTHQDFGPDASRWRSWIQKQAGRHRIEWLMDALLHEDEVRRTAAAAELQQLTQQYLGYHPKLPLRDRQVAQEKYRAWWERDGRASWAD